MPSETRMSVPVGAGAVAGVGASLLGYLVTYLWQADRLEQSFAGLNVLLDLFGSDGVPTWKAVGWLYYGAQFTPVAVSLPGGSRVSGSLVGGDGAPALLYVLPPLLLALAGFAVARYADAGDVQRGALAGAAVAPAVLVLAVVGVFATRVAVAEATVAPVLATGVLLAGLVYPVAFGAVGGVLGAVTR